MIRRLWAVVNRWLGMGYYEIPRNQYEPVRAPFWILDPSAGVQMAFWWHWSRFSSAFFCCCANTQCVCWDVSAYPRLSRFVKRIYRFKRTVAPRYR